MMRRAGYLLFLLYAVWAWSGWKPVPVELGADMYNYWLPVQAIRREQVDNIYSWDTEPMLRTAYQKEAGESPYRELRYAALEKWTARLTITGTPVLIGLARLFMPDDYHDAVVWQRRLSFVGYFAAIAGFLFMAGVPALLWAPVAAVCVHGVWPLLADGGNVNEIQLGWLALALVAMGRGDDEKRLVLGGAVLGAWYLFKPMFPHVPFLLGMLCLRSSKRRAVLFTAGFSTGVVVSLALARLLTEGAAPWHEWASTVKICVDRYLHISTVAVFFGAPSVAMTAALSASLAAVAGMVVWRGGVPSSVTPLADNLRLRVAGLGLVIGVVAAQFLHDHYMLHVLLMLVVVALSRALRRRFGSGEAVFAAILLPASAIVFRPHFGFWDPPRDVFIGLPLILVALLWEYRLAAREAAR